jgi:hypothetical protein
MPYCADRNILVRWTEPGTAACDLARAAVKALHAEGETVYITAGLAGDDRRYAHG